MTDFFVSSAGGSAAGSGIGDPRCCWAWPGGTLLERTSPTVTPSRADVNQPEVASEPVMFGVEHK